MIDGLVDGVLIVAADNLDVLRLLPDGCLPLVYTDPPFNTGSPRTGQRLRTERDAEGDRTGFGGQRYRSVAGLERSYADAFDDYLGFLEPRLRELHRVLADDGSFYLHLDYREVHATKLLLDDIFGRASFVNEIIWAYDYGGKPKRRWPAKHDNILFYVKDPGRYHFDAEAVDRIPYMAPGLVTPEKARRGKRATDVWWHTIVPTAGKERTGYPTQKPLGIVRRIVQASAPPGSVVTDLFAGSGTAGAAALALDRRALLVDDNPEAIEVMRARLPDATVVDLEGLRERLES